MDLEAFSLSCVYPLRGLCLIVEPRADYGLSGPFSSQHEKGKENQ